MAEKVQIQPFSPPEKLFQGPIRILFFKFYSLWVKTKIYGYATPPIADPSSLNPFRSFIENTENIQNFFDHL